MEKAELIEMGEPRNDEDLTRELAAVGIELGATPTGTEVPSPSEPPLSLELPIRLSSRSTMM